MLNLLILAKDMSISYRRNILGQNYDPCFYFMIIYVQIVSKRREFIVLDFFSLGTFLCIR